jgi:hypothetical protein
LGTILYWFFWLQFETRLGLKKRPVSRVDHPLDTTIPFVPGDIKKYLEFISLWMKSLSYFLYTRLRERGKTPASKAKALEETLAYLRGLGRLYREAGLIYRQRQSATARPPLSQARGHLRFYLVHFFDPHLHCVPSLHVSVVLYNFFMMKKLLKPGEDLETAYALGEARAIIDTILTVKQHSINCVAAGLYFLHALYPADFSRDAAGEIIAGLLLNRGIETAGELRAYVLSLFRRFCALHDAAPPMAGEDQGAPWRGILLDFLQGCPSFRS